MLVMILIVSVLVWKHKRKMQNFLPCKSSPQNRCDVSGANGVIYEDLTNIHPRALPNHCPPGHVVAPSIEMTDVQTLQPGHYGAGFPPQLLGSASVFICPPPRVGEPCYAPQVDLYNPVYEELSNGSEGSRESEEGNGHRRTAAGRGGDRACSEDEFAEDELSLAGDVAPPAVAPTPPPASTMPSRRHHLHQHEEPTSGTSSLQGSTGNDLCRDLDSSDADDRGKHSETDSFLAMRMNLNNRNNMSLPPGRRSREPPPPPPNHPTRIAERRPKSLDRRRGWRNSPRNRPSKPPSPPPAGLEPAAFHEGLILDALGGYPRGLMYTGGRSNRGSQLRSPPHQPPAYHLPYSHVMTRQVNPYESVSVLGLDPPPRPELTSFRPHPKNSSSQDSFNSDSGFSNHTTSGGRAASGGGSSRGRHGELYDSIQRPLPPLLS
ncbi:hypothetical protein B566_EDAN008898 [Ephemera danica]|nr:hypothetical protein B566_EDAN008898 [Ephemera danica]